MLPIRLLVLYYIPECESAKSFDFLNHITACIFETEIAL